MRNSVSDTRAPASRAPIGRRVVRGEQSRSAVRAHARKKKLRARRAELANEVVVTATAAEEEENQTEEERRGRRRQSTRRLTRVSVLQCARSARESLLAGKHRCRPAVEFSESGRYIRGAVVAYRHEEQCVWL